MNKDGLTSITWKKSANLTGTGIKHTTRATKTTETNILLLTKFLPLLKMQTCRDFFLSYVNRIVCLIALQIDLHQRHRPGKTIVTHLN